MFINEDDLEKLTRTYETDIALNYLKKIEERHFTLDKHKQTNYHPSYKKLHEIIENWESLICVL